MDRVNKLEKEIADLRKLLVEKESELYELKKALIPDNTNGSQNVHPTDDNTCKVQMGLHLQKSAIERYSRQILLPEIGVSGQKKLCAARVLIVGAGGLGCPAAAYLAGAGVGAIGIVDYDTVDVTNIHRQILHGESDQSMNKADSAAQSLRKLNSQIAVRAYNTTMTSSNALDVVAGYDAVLDCTDNVPTRYLLADATAMSKIPLISGSALKMEGQLTTYGYRADRDPGQKDQRYIGPCYRCLFPEPPPAETVGSCSAQGVAGPVPGVIGVLQALEAIKLIVGQAYSNLLVERMLLFDGEDATFRVVKLRPRNPRCAVCSENPAITKLIDYEAFCKAQAKEKDLDLNILPQERRVTPAQLAAQLRSGAEQRHLLVDVRSEPEFRMCRIDGAVNHPIDSLHGERLQRLIDAIREGAGQVTFICRRGNDSQVAAKRLLDLMDDTFPVTDVIGGLHAWSTQVDHDFPVY